MTRVTTLMIAILFATEVAEAGKIEVWVDDAQTRKIEVDEVDPDEIADPSSWSLGHGFSLGANIGVSVGWARESGVTYDEINQKLIDDIKELCDEFNDEQLSLETYHRRLRRLYASLEESHVCRARMIGSVSQASQNAMDSMDKALGRSTRKHDEVKTMIDRALDAFGQSVKAVALSESKDPYAFVDERELNNLNAEKRPTPRREVAESLNQFSSRVKGQKPTAKETEKIVIWRDRARSGRIEVDKLDTENLVRDVAISVGLQLKYSAPLYSPYIGPRLTWAVESKAKYDETAQLLILKYRRLCFEYNACLLSQEEYLERLSEIFKAEKRAFQARRDFRASLQQQADEAVKEMERRLPKGIAPSFVNDLEKLRNRKRADVDKHLDSRPQKSIVDAISKEHLLSVEDSLARFHETVDEVDLDLGGDTVDVYLTDERRRKETVPRLDTDAFVQNVETRLTLHLKWFDFGPELTWAKNKGLDYCRHAQRLILKYKQLCMDYNAGLVSQQAFLRHGESIEASIERAGKLRAEMARFIQELKGGALKELDRQLDLMGRGQ